MMCGIPVNKISESENKKLNNMFETISSKVVGQDGAIKKMVSAIQRGRVGMKDPNKPLLSAMLIGNSGTGKCISKTTKVTLRNKETGKIEEIDINNLIQNLSNFKKSK